MSEIVVDSSVAVKWLVPEPDSGKAFAFRAQALAAGDRLVVLDLLFPEVANAIWKSQRRGLITSAEADGFIALLSNLRVGTFPALDLLKRGYEIAKKYDRSVYDALFVALVEARGARGVTADRPLLQAVEKDFPQIALF